MNFIIIGEAANQIPEEIEEKLVKSPYIEEILVFSPDDENIQAIIHPNIDEVRTKLHNMGKEVNDDSVWEFIKSEVRNVNETLEIYKRIRHFAIRYEEFPKTTTRKVKRHLFKNINLTRETKVVRD